MILLALLSFLTLIVPFHATKCAENEACLYFTLCGVPGAIEKVEFYNSSTLFTPHLCAVVPTHQTFEMHFRPIDAHGLFIHLESTMSSLKNIEFAMNKVSFRFAEWNNLIVKEGQETIGKPFTDTSTEGYPFVGNFTITTKESAYEAFSHLLVTVGNKTWSLPGFAERLRDSVPSAPEPEDDDDHIGWAIFGSLILLLLIGGGIAACCYAIYHMESLDDL